MVVKYSKKADGKMALSRNFHVWEFACNDGSDTILIDLALVALLQEIRDHFGAPITINSAYRTDTYNKKVGGAPASQHKLGTAADIQVAGHTPEEVACYAETLQPKNGGIGVYTTFTHVDVRKGRARWDSRSGKEIAVDGWFSKSEADLAVEWANKIGVMKGDANGDMMLDQPLTRKQFAVMLYRYANR